MRSTKNLRTKSENLAEIKYGHLCLCPRLRKIFCECMSKENTRYAINRLYVGKTEMAVTDGRRLFTVGLAGFEQGLFYVTSDGYCLRTEDGLTFPKYGDILLKPKDCKVVFDKSYAADQRFVDETTYELHRAGSYFNLDMLIVPLLLIVKLHPENIKISVAKENPNERPFMITGVLLSSMKSNASFSYIQMPLHQAK